MRVIDDYPWKYGTLNLADPELRVKTEEARHYVTDALSNIDLGKSGLHIWHLKDGALQHWRRENYGTFYDKECFLLLNIRSTRQLGDKPDWTIHLWLGRWATRDDHEMAVYKTAELSARLNHDAVIHREAQGKETAVFLGYFHFITYYKGSADEDYWLIRLKRGTHPTRLLKVYRPDSKSDHYRVTEVPARHNQLNNSFVYVMDRGSTITQWNGQLCTTDDVIQATQFVQSRKAARGLDIKIDILNDNGEPEGGNPFYMLLSRSSYMNVDEDEEDEHKTLSFPASKRSSTGAARGLLLRVVHQHSNPQFKKIKDGVISMKDFSKEVQCVLDLDEICFLWYSHKMDVGAKNTSLEVIHEYLRNTNHALKPAVIVSEGQSSPLLTKLIGRH